MKMLTIASPKYAFYNALHHEGDIIKSGKWIGGKVLGKKGNTKPFTHIKVKLVSWSSQHYFIAEIKEVERLRDVILDKEPEPSFLFKLGIVNHSEIPVKDFLGIK